MEMIELVLIYHEINGFISYSFEHGKTLPFINPSSLETLRALVQEIQSSGETDPEIWKDCEELTLLQSNVEVC
uniref:Uncharacterized protein n=1 Tax=Poecilia mexicana TaxID=48701 RepID=A0A3B3WF86_9TELE